MSEAPGNLMEKLRKRIEELEARHEKFLHEFWKTNADNERLRAVYEAAKRHVAHDSDSSFADIRRDESALISALATVEEK